MTAHPTEQLSLYLDGALDAGVRADVDAHLAGCLECRAVLDDLARVALAARGWQADTMSPAMDLWPAVAARLDPRPASLDGRVVPWHRRRWSVGIAELALAASVVAALGTALVLSRSRANPTVAPVPIVAEAEPTDGTETPVQAVSFADAQFDAAVTDLERVLREQRERLNPRTVLVLERNLGIIDDAIREARTALAADPANALLNAHLADARRRKLALLRHAMQIPVGD